MVLAFDDMRCKRLRWILAVAAIVLPAAVLHAALPTEPDVSGRTSFAGQLLIASPGMHDPFDHAVILMAQHSRDGALGIVINHPLGSRPIASLLEALGADRAGSPTMCAFFLGGPVSPNIAFVLHSADYRRDRHVYTSTAASRSVMPPTCCAISGAAKGRARVWSRSAMPAGRRRSLRTRWRVAPG